MRFILKTAILAGTAIGAAGLFWPGAVPAAYALISGNAALTAATCAAAPDVCYDLKQRALVTVRERLLKGRAQSDEGLQIVATEAAKQQELLDANSGLQTILRGRYADSLRSNAGTLLFQGRSYTRAEAEQQAALLVAEEANFKSGLVELNTRRGRLNEARMAAVVESNRVSAAIATLSAEKAILVANYSLEKARTLLEESQRVERRAEETSLALVRSTEEMARNPSLATAPRGPAFDLSGWLSGAPRSETAP